MAGSKDKQIFVRRNPRPSKYEHLIDEPMNQGFTYKEYLRQNKIKYVPDSVKI